MIILLLTAAEKREKKSDKDTIRVCFVWIRSFIGLKQSKNNVISIIDSSFSWSEHFAFFQWMFLYWRPSNERESLMKRCESRCSRMNIYIFMIGLKIVKRTAFMGDWGGKRNSEVSNDIIEMLASKEFLFVVEFHRILSMPSAFFCWYFKLHFVISWGLKNHRDLKNTLKIEINQEKSFF